MQTEREWLGYLVVGARRFNRSQHDLQALLAFQLAGALSNARLHRQVVEAFQALQESRAQLVQSSKLAAVGELAAGMAHEVNTPLGSILLMVDSVRLLFEKNPERATDKLDLIKKEIRRVHAIVEKLLYYSRDAGGGRQQVEMPQIVEDTLASLRHPTGCQECPHRASPGGRPPGLGQR